MKFSASRIIAIICTAILLIFVFISSASNIHLLIDATEKTADEKTGFSSFVAHTQYAYTQGDFEHKTDYINLNGLFARITGRTVYNEVAQLKNGMLINEKLNPMDSFSAAERTKVFNDFIEQCGGKFLYVQAPYKLDIENSLLPVGFDFCANERAENMLLELKKRDIKTLDLRQTMARNAEDLEKYFYKTDHHWNTAGGFYAFNQIFNEMAALFPEKNLKGSFTSENAWNAKTYEKWFLGSQGKRVGTLFAGIDDFVLFTPKAETNLSAYIPHHREFRKGDFSAVNVIESYLDEPDYFKDNTYCTYVGGDYKLMQYRNANAANDIKVLILKDSFTLPVQAFLSTEVRELDVIDPRYFDESTLAQYVELNRPDLVIMLLNPWSMEGEKYYNHGAFDAYKYLEQKQTLLYTAKSFAKPILAENLAANTKYGIAFGSAERGDCSHLILELYESETNSLITSRAVDFDYLKSEKAFDWNFITPNEKNSTYYIKVSAENDITLKNLRIYKYS